MGTLKKLSHTQILDLQDESYQLANLISRPSPNITSIFNHTKAICRLVSPLDFKITDIHLETALHLIEHLNCRFGGANLIELIENGESAVAIDQLKGIFADRQAYQYSLDALVIELKKFAREEDVEISSSVFHNLLTNLAKRGEGNPDILIGMIGDPSLFAAIKANLQQLDSHDCSHLKALHGEVFKDTPNIGVAGGYFINYISSGAYDQIPH